MTNTLQSLKGRIEAATGPDLELDLAIYGALIFKDMDQLAPGETNPMPKPYTASIDAALALVERLLPGWAWRIEYWPSAPVTDDHLPAMVEMWERDAEGWYHSPLIRINNARGATPALALLSALVSALIAKEHNHEE